MIARQRLIKGCHQTTCCACLWCGGVEDHGAGAPGVFCSRTQPTSAVPTQASPRPPPPHHPRATPAIRPVGISSPLCDLLRKIDGCATCMHAGRGGFLWAGTISCIASASTWRPSRISLASKPRLRRHRGKFLWSFLFVWVAKRHTMTGAFVGLMTPFVFLSYCGSAGQSGRQDGFGFPAGDASWTERPSRFRILFVRCLCCAGFHCIARGRVSSLGIPQSGALSSTGHRVTTNGLPVRPVCVPRVFALDSGCKRTGYFNTVGCLLECRRCVPVPGSAGVRRNTLVMAVRVLLAMPLLFLGTV